MRIDASRVAALVVALAATGPAMACTVDATPLSFGAIDPLALADADSTATITVTCPATTSYSIGLSSTVGGPSPKMQSGADRLDYRLYTDASRSVPWGDGGSGTATVGGEAGPGGSDHTVHGRVPADAGRSPGVYSDSVLITVTY